MEMRNKLYRHHKSKASFVLRHFSIGLFAFILGVSAITIPTYFSVREDERISLKASEEETEEKDKSAIEKSEEEEIERVSKELLNY